MKMMMNCALTLLALILVISSTVHADEGICMRRPTIRCRPNYHPAATTRGCYRCVPNDNSNTSEENSESNEDYNCLREPVMECAKKNELVENVVGCYVCVPKKVPFCLKKPTLTCAQGSFIARNSKGCFVCSKN